MHRITDWQPYQGPRLHAFSFPTDTAVFAIGDVHGCSAKLRELLETLADVHTPHRERVLVFLGDLPDRGPDTLGAFALASTAGRDYGFDRTVHLPGNHELLMRDALLHLMDGGSLRHDTPMAWLENGGKTALWEIDIDWTLEPQKAAHAFVDALPTWKGQPWLDRIANAPSHLRVGDAVFVHAGVQPHLPLRDALGMALDDHLYHPDHWAWIRQPFLDWTAGFAETGPCKAGDTTSKGVLIVHGHTAPTTVSASWLDHPNRLLDGLARVRQAARLNLDAGSARQLLVAGAVLTNQGWRLAAADGHR